ncbi:DUF4870 domain-containing protein [Telluribacter sp.]|jgi:hypothetical protein|uniref:DUF4870 domain-containing protein n=1 Tax=Telluribacter sp. TaxID=1978767 RepID=UPI002E0D96BF|nr:DUF4870 domain-containing protein [Telluribacter sp.]
MENQPYTTSSTSQETSASDRNLGMWMHLAPLLSIFLNVFIPIPFLGLVVVLVLYYSQRDKSAFARANGITSLNFQITLSLACIAIFLFSMIFFGGSMLSIFMGGATENDAAAGAGMMGLVGMGMIVGLLLLVIGIGAIILMIIGSVRANNGQVYKYPLAIGFVK